jgi:hypothetical protein
MNEKYTLSRAAAKKAEMAQDMLLLAAVHS